MFADPHTQNSTNEWIFFRDARLCSKCEEICYSRVCSNKVSDCIVNLVYVSKSCARHLNSNVFRETYSFHKSFCVFDLTDEEELNY